MDSPSIRQSFIDFFLSKGHQFVPSAPVVPAEDPTLMFTNAGMNQFKDIFLGQPRSYRRAVNSQKCIRVSGKHNDLEEVGYDTYHHTFFEMLGNWSFGDYYKKEAISWAWELLTEVWKLPKEKLYATVYKDDDEAEKLWREISGLPDERIMRFGNKENFWEMGDTGPCGPCSEIHIDLGEAACDKKNHPNHTCRVNGDCGRYIEIWNLVFIQYNRKEDNSLVELADKHIDTGMGFERVTAIIQNKTSNYDTDIFQPIIQDIALLTKHTYLNNPTPFRVIADHVRTVTFAIADGVMPSNDGRGYVIRRLLRRASRYGKKIDLHEPFLFQISRVVQKMMGGFFPEIRQKGDYIAEVIRAEEENFLETLEQGIQRFQILITKPELIASKVIPGEDVFRLYDTYGFPVDLTALMAKENNFFMDMEGFENALNKQRERGRSHAKADDVLLRLIHRLNEVKTADELLKLTVDFADEANKNYVGQLFKYLPIAPTKFLGYEHLTSESEIIGFFDVLTGTPRHFLDTLKNNNLNKEENEFWLLVDQTPCYGESGGQGGDRGEASFNGEIIAKIIDTQKREDRIFHKIQFIQEAIKNIDTAKLSPGAKLTLKVDRQNRLNIAAHHSATHALQFALRKVLGDHVGQTGSQVNADRLRFDFSHFRAMTDTEIKQVEDLVNNMIAENYSAQVSESSLAEAKQAGAIAFFGEKYGERVRMVQMGESVELCGGTHVKETAEMLAFVILKESSPGAGMRRIEALAGSAAVKYLRQRKADYEDLARKAQVSPDKLNEFIGNLQQKMKELQSEAKGGQKKNTENEMLPAAEEIEKNILTINGYQFLAMDLGEAMDINTMRDLADRYRQKLTKGIVFFATRLEGKLQLILAVNKSLTPQPINANVLFKQAMSYIDGSGGGRPDFVQAGGKKIDGLPKAFLAIQDFLSKLV